MIEYEGSIIINAPVEQVFEYWADPMNRPEVWPSLVEVSDVQPLPNGGETHRWVYKMAGVRLAGTAETLEFVPNRRIVEKETNSVEATFTWTFEPANGGTKMTTKVEYTVPVPVLGKVAERFIIKANEREAQLISENIKARIETGST